MALQIGIVGLPNVGKSTLFNALTQSKGAEAANYPFCTIDPNTGMVEVPDQRLSTLTEMYQPQKVIPATIEFVDIAGLVKGASKGEGLGNQFLAAIREVHAICHVVRAFEDSNITHVDGSIDPHRDRETIEMELMLSDIESLTKRIEKLQGPVRSGDKDKKRELEVAEKILSGLNEQKIGNCVALTEDEELIAKEFHLLTRKPIIYAINVTEDQIASVDIHDIRTQLKLTDGDECILICAKIEEDLQELSAEESAEYLKDLGIESSGLDTLIHSAYRALGYITYFTAGEKEVRAWTITNGMKAPQAAGVIHTDFERGFIRAETIAYDDLIATGSESAAKEAGKLRSEGKEYVVQDGDVMHFRFNT